MLEVVNPHRTLFTPSQYAQMQQEVNAGSKLVQIRDLQRVNRYALC